MSTDNHDQSKPCVSKPPAPARIELNADENAFDGRRIKKERTDVSLENGDGSSINAGVNDNNKQLQPSQQRPAAGRFSNGFHDDDLLQDIIAAKFTAPANHGTTSKYDKIRLMIEDSISEESKARIEEIFSQIEQLKIEERLLLYLKLPLSLTNAGGTVDPLRQPLNPLGNRYEIHQTIMWIKTHLEEDPDVSLPKQDVYDEYNMYCMRNSMKPLSTADFGKVMKQVYPKVRPRRLGTRGNSRYCYAGMRKRVKLDPPTLPNISGTQTGDEVDENITEEMLGAASTLIREWAESLLGLKFPTLSALARHLVDNLCVDARSLSAVCILCASGNSNTSTNKESNTDMRVTPVSGKSGKLREAQLQLQRKLQQREHIRDQKHRHLDAVIQNQNKEKTVDNKAGANKGNRKAKSNQSSQGTNVSSGQNALTKLSLTAVVANRQKKVLKASSQPCNISLESNCDNIVVQSIEDVQNNSNPSVVMTNCVNTQRDIKPKNSRKRANPILLNQPSETSPEKQTKLTEQQMQENVEHSNVLLPKLASIQRPGQISVILAGNIKPAKCKTNEAASNQPAKNCDNEPSTCSKSCIKVNGCPATFDSSSNATEEPPSTVLTKDQIRLLQENSNLVVGKSEKLGSIDSDALDDYLNGGNNSQEQEEELLQYFQQSNSSSSDVEANAIAVDEQISRSDKVSQLRLILQQNLKGGTVHAPIDVVPTTIIRQNVEKREITQKHNLILPTLLNHSNQSNTRRRVSFETNVVEHVQDSNVITNTVPQSPNTRRRIFNFTPISPGPHSPINGRASKSNSANASPFVSPRNTPVPRSRSNLQATSSRARAHKSLSRSISCSMPYTNKNTFVVPTSGPELVRQASSTPQLPLISTKSSEVQVDGSSGATQISVAAKRDGQGGAQQCAAFLPSDLAPQKQLLINYPSQENLQEIKNVYQKSQPPDQEISELFHNNKQFTNELYRSQSVPLHRMVNPALMSPISTQHCLSSFQSQSFNPSTSSSIAPTPVPSEFNDFGSIGQSEGTSAYLLDDPNFISDDQNFLMGDKEITPENITNILNILDEEGTESLQILPEQPAEEALIENNGIVLDALPNSNLNLSEEDMLDPSNVLDIPVGGPLQKIIQSRSYPNTPLPVPVSTYTPSYAEDSNGSRSYPSTPLHTVQSQEAYQETNEPMLSSPTLNSLNLHNETANESTSSSLCRNVVDFANFLEEADTETNDLDPLGNFEGLQDVDSLTPLFNEVTEPNR